MKKILSVVAVVAIISTSCASVPAPPPVAVAPAPVAVTTPVVQEVTYEEPLPLTIKSYYPNGDPSGSVVYQYTPKGLLARQESYNGNGVLIEVRTGKTKGDLWRITVTNAQNGEVSSLEDRTVGSQGELLVQTFLNSKEVIQAANEYAYDNQGRKILWLAKTGSGGLQARTTYQYDSRGNNTKTEVYDAGGVLTNVFESTYNELGQVVTRKGFDAALNLVEQTNFTWKDGKKVKDETTKPLLRTIEYSYGEKAAPTAIVSSVRGKVVERQTLDYQWFTKTKTLSP